MRYTVSKDRGYPVRSPGPTLFACNMLWLATTHESRSLVHRGGGRCGAGMAAPEGPRRAASAGSILRPRRTHHDAAEGATPRRSYRSSGTRHGYGGREESIALAASALVHAGRATLCERVPRMVPAHDRRSRAVDRCANSICADNDTARSQLRGG